MLAHPLLKSDFCLSLVVEGSVTGLAFHPILQVQIKYRALYAGFLALFPLFAVSSTDLLGLAAAEMASKAKLFPHSVPLNGHQEVLG